MRLVTLQSHKTWKTLIRTSRSMSTVPSFAKNFPDSTAVPSTYFHWPGSTSQSTQVTRRVLEENDRKHDIYERVRFAHNHFPHSILTRYALGAPPKLLEDTWEHDEPHLATLDPEDDHRETGDLGRLPDKITRENWDDPKTLGFKDAYSRYLVFFHQEVDRLGPLGAVKEYVLSPQANCNSQNGHPAPQMLVHMVAGVLHPFIHVGFGLEFRDVVVLAEGLAEAAIHDKSIMAKLFPATWPKSELTPHPSPPRSPSVDKWGQPQLTSEDKDGKSLFEVYATFANDTELVAPPYDPKMMINDRLAAGLTDGRAEKLVGMVDEWSLSDEVLSDGPLGYEKVLEDIGVLVTLLACATGREGKAPRIDFFMMHTLTSSIFLSAYMAALDPPARRAILRTYLLAVFATTIARGKPTFDIDYLMSAPLSPVAPGTTPKKSVHREYLSDPSDESTRNPWTGIVESSLYATDSHVPKSIRPLLHYASKLGNTPPGGFALEKNGKAALPGLDKLDGTMFVRAAGLVMDVMGWCREGEKAGDWEHDPIGYDEIWK